jgi:RNA polymerase sigma factor (sigma-70 family)
MTLHDDIHDQAEVGETADADLVLRSRSGDSSAFGELWRRHYTSGLTVARSITSSIDPDDLVQEAYARIFQSIQRGGGPTGSFRAYLFTSIRNTAAAWGRARRETAVDELDTVADPASTEQAADDALDRSLTHQAFRSLPTRWQEVLWYTEIEQMKPSEIAPLLGLKPTAVAQLAFRAREGLREAWIQAHLRSVADGSDCQWTIERLGAYARNNLGKRDLTKIEAHLGDCARCAIVASEARQVSGRLVLILLPLTVGIGAGASYLASVQGGGAPIAAMAAMPSSVVQGAVVAGPGAPGGASTSGTGSATGSGASGGGILTGAGGVAGLVAASVLVAGGVVAAIVVPTVLRGPAAVTRAEVSDQAVGRAAPVPVTHAPTPTPSDIPVLSPTPAPPVVPAPVRIASPVEPATPVVRVEPAPKPAPAPATTTPPAEPTPTPAPTEPDPTPTPTDPTPTPSPTDPTPTPSPTDPTGEPTDPTAPTGTPALGTGTVTVENHRFVIAVPITGRPGSAVEVVMGDDPAQTVTLDAAGTATVTLRPRLIDLMRDAVVRARYSAVPDASDLSVTLSDLVDLAQLIAALGSDDPA